MRWPWRRQPAHSTPALATDRVKRPGRCEDEPGGPLLAFALAHLHAAGARIRREGDVLAATLPGGTMTRYTTLAEHASDATQLLVPGGATLSAMLDETAAHARAGALTLARTGDVTALVRDTLAAPAKGCGHCVFGSPDALFVTCEACPLRAGRSQFVVAGLTRHPRTLVVREGSAASAELTFRVSGRDRNGRTEERVRLALDDEMGRRVEPLSLAQIRAASAGTLSPDAVSVAATAIERARVALEPTLAAACVFLRQRASEAYRQRQDDVTALHTRLRREQPEEERSLADSLTRELAALAEVYSVEVEAALESVWMIESPVAEVRVGLPSGVQAALTVDIGRWNVIATCSSCGVSTTSGAICAGGHVSCAACLPGCPICSGVGASSSAADQASQAKPAARTDSAALSVEHVEELASLTPRLWSQCITWLLEQAGYEAGGPESSDDALIWHATRDGQPCVIKWLRLPPGWSIAPNDVRRMAAARAQGTHVLLICPAPCSEAARSLAVELDVTLWDRDELERLLAQMANQYARGTAQEFAATKERSAAAVKTRTHLLRALERAARVLDGANNGGRVTGHAALRSALAELAAVRQSAEQAFLAWETLVGDWLAAFSERLSPAGALILTADESRLRDLRERATHLGKVLAQVFERLCRTPVNGEMGYDAWCAALIEEFDVRCAALIARIATVDPAAWEDAERARGPEAAQAAEHAAQQARHAAARAAKAYAQVAALVGAM